MPKDKASEHSPVPPRRAASAGAATGSKAVPKARQSTAGAARDVASSTMPMAPTASVPAAFLEARPVPLATERAVALGPAPVADAAPTASRSWVYRHVSSAIVEGVLWPGLRLPSARELSRAWSVARGAVDDALMRLAREGLLERRAGRGSFIARRLPPGMVREVSGRAALAQQAGEALGALAPLLRLARTRSKEAPSPADGRTREMARPAAVAAVPAAAARLPTSTTLRTPTTPPVAELPAGATASISSPPRRLRLDPRVSDIELFPLAVWRRCLAAAHAEADRSSLCYGLPGGWPALREATARHLALTRAIECSAEQVIILNGPLQALDLVVRVLLEPGDRVLVERPGYMSIVRTLGLPPVDLRGGPVDDDGLDVDAARRECPAPALIYVHPLQQYPTGARLSMARRAALLAWARECRAWVIEGDHLGEIVHDGAVPPPLLRAEALAAAQRAEQGTVLRSGSVPSASDATGASSASGASADDGESGQVLFLGTYNGVMFPSLRLSYLVVPKPLVPVFTVVRGLFGDHPPLATQQALAAFIDGGHLSTHIRRMRQVYRRRRDVALAAARAHLPSEVTLGPMLGGTHGCFYLPPGCRDEPLAQRLGDAGFGIEMLSAYSWPREGRHGIVFGYGADDEARIEGDVREMAALVDASLRAGNPGAGGRVAARPPGRSEPPVSSGPSVAPSRA